MSQSKFVPWTDAEFKEIASDLTLQDRFGFVNGEDFERALPDEYTAKIPSYITDGPGYAGELFVIVHGIPNATVIGRRGDGTFFIDDEA